MKHVTMADVARSVGVNKGTVSRALKGDRRISPATRQRVWEAAKKLGYKLDAVASGLSSRHSGVIGVVMERMKASWAGEFLSAVAGVLSRCKMELLLLEAGDMASPVVNVLRRVEGRKVDGLIWFGEKEFDPVDLDIPVVRVGRQRNGKEYLVRLEQDGTLERVRSLLGGQPVVYRGGPDAFMEFLAGLQTEEGSGDPFVIWDGLKELPAGELPSLVCGDERLARWVGAYALRVPVRELGILTARVLSNVIRETGVRPAEILLNPPLISPQGEHLLRQIPHNAL